MQTIYYLKRTVRIGALGSVCARWCSCYRGGVSLGISENEFKMRILRNVEITPRGWLYLGHPGDDNPPIGAATLRPDGFRMLPPLKRYTKALGVLTLRQS